MPEVREEKCKPVKGNVELSAYYFAGNVHIRIKDDGAGIDPDKILNKAKEKGIVREDQRLSKQEILQLIFAPGFSMAKKVTDLSGRGVGMDVVKRNIESMRGRVQIESEIDKGSTFIIELPLTLAIVDGILTKTGSETFIIPTLSIIEFIKPTKDMIHAPLEQMETLCFRGQNLPIFRLSDFYNIKPNYIDPEDSTIVVVESQGEYYAIMIDEVVGTYSTVIKSLGTMYKNTKGLSGCAIMPDGSVGLILDVATFVQFAKTTQNNFTKERQIIKHEIVEESNLLH